MAMSTSRTMVCALPMPNAPRLCTQYSTMQRWNSPCSPHYLMRGSRRCSQTTLTCSSDGSNSSARRYFCPLPLALCIHWIPVSLELLRRDEYSYNATQIPPEWHAWMHYLGDYAPHNADMSGAKYTVPMDSEGHNKTGTPRQYYQKGADALSCSETQLLLSLYLFSSMHRSLLSQATGRTPILSQVHGDHVSGGSMNAGSPVNK